jgi:SNF2 family DNA or RNA helicase
MMRFFNKKLVDWSFNEEGVAIFFSNPKDFALAEAGRGNAAGLEIIARFQALLETGEASAKENLGGIFLPAGDAVRLDDATRECFSLPPKWPGFLQLETHSVPNLKDFSANLRLIDLSGYPLAWKLHGGILKVAGEHYLPSPETFHCLRAFLNWKAVSDRSELENLQLIHALSEAARRGCKIDYSRVGKIDVRPAREVIVDAREQKDGTILLTPVPIVHGLADLLGSDVVGGTKKEEKVNSYLKKIEERLSQLDTNAPAAIMRIGSTIVLLDSLQTKHARAIANKRIVSKESVSEFQKNPEKWLSINHFVHSDVDFLPRVIGIGEWSGGYLGAAGELGEKIIWFDKKPEAEKEEVSAFPEEDIAESDIFNGEEPVDPNKQVTLIEKNEYSLAWGKQRSSVNLDESVKIAPDFTKYARKPYPHQLEAIEWLGRCALYCGKPEKWTDGAMFWGAGALLADDMGLGKTLSTLVFLREWFVAWQNKTGSLPPACLIVCPLSLIENWQQEICKTYSQDLNPFSRVLRAIPAGDLSNFYCTPNGRDIVRPGTTEGGGEVERYGLKFGSADSDSLDMPGTVILTTYTTLRDYRFSFAGCNWSAVVFDEAQNIKNPNAFQTIAAKSLKGFFRLALSGTPVENHLGDLWCLMDAVEPGALDSFAEFRKKWIHPIRNDQSMLEKIGQDLRNHLGDLICRRTKEESLEGLPRKIQAPPDRPPLVDMTERQAEFYDEIVDCANSLGSEVDSSKKNNQWLACLWELRRVSLHPDLLGDASTKKASAKDESRKYLRQSGKLIWLLDLLDEICAKGEKVLIFAIQKKFQDMLRDHLSVIYELKIPVINGDTKAIEKSGPNPTRMQLIDRFSEKPGFGICILSPIAAGAGLNITAANHVIHLERHWNPAKEDQATDRAYRIGQKRDVYVYTPLLRHPSRELATFDQSLHKLITQKKKLAGSLGFLPMPPVSQSEIFAEVFGNVGESSSKKPIKKLTTEEANALSWEHFEALISCIYESESDRVILTPRGRDHGVDVVVLGHRTHGNMLVQVKTTTTGSLDSEEAIRELEGGRLFYQQALSLRFEKMRVHTNVSKFSSRTLKAAKVYKTELLGAEWVEVALKKKSITLANIIERTANRCSVSV